ncbi:MAG: TetR/AcrR family transcriptional regulator [Actinomycetota bacterium]|nr:TetR/AcrR family transcriptional regulator [Actinomycetota bacterium]
MPKLAAEAKEQRRRRLVDAAWRCVARGGYRTLRVDDVCAEAGLSKGAFYTYFDHKHDLLLALLDDDAEGMTELVADAGSQSGGVEQIRRFVAGLVERGSDGAAVQLRADLWAEISSDEGLRLRFLEAMQHRRMCLAAVIDSAVAAGDLVDVPANALAAVFLALGDGLMLHRVLDPAGFRWPNVRRAVDAILDGLRAQENDR